jgi:hypothetical protein
MKFLLSDFLKFAKNKNDYTTKSTKVTKVFLCVLCGLCGEACPGAHRAAGQGLATPVRVTANAAFMT